MNVTREEHRLVLLSEHLAKAWEFDNAAVLDALREISVTVDPTSVNRADSDQIVIENNDANQPLDRLLESENQIMLVNRILEILETLPPANPTIDYDETLEGELKPILIIERDSGRCSSLSFSRQETSYVNRSC